MSDSSSSQHDDDESVVLPYNDISLDYGTGEYRTLGSMRWRPILDTIHMNLCFRPRTVKQMELFLWQHVLNHEGRFALSTLRHLDRDLVLQALPRAAPIVDRLFLDCEMDNTKYIAEFITKCRSLRAIVLHKVRLLKGSWPNRILHGIANNTSTQLQEFRLYLVGGYEDATFVSERTVRKAFRKFPARLHSWWLGSRSGDERPLDRLEYTVLLRGLHKHPHVQDLELDGPVDDAVESFVVSLPNLKEIGFMRAKESNYMGWYLSRSQPFLEKISHVSLNVDRSPCFVHGAFRQLQECYSILRRTQNTQMLRLSFDLGVLNDVVTPELQDLIDSFSTLSNLTCLRLYIRDDSQWPDHLLAPGAPKLTRLEIHDSAISAQLRSLPLPLDNFPCLTYLDLGRRLISPDTLRTFRAKDCKLSTLILQAQPAKRMVQLLSVLQRNTSLEKLVISYDAWTIAHERSQALEKQWQKTLASNKTLQSLSIDNVTQQMSPNGFGKILANNSCSFEFLKLKCVEGVDESIKSLRTNSTLISLHLSTLNHTCFDALVQVLPHLTHLRKLYFDSGNPLKMGRSAEFLEALHRNTSLCLLDVERDENVWREQETEYFGKLFTRRNRVLYILSSQGEDEPNLLGALPGVLERAACNTTGLFLAVQSMARDLPVFQKSRQTRKRRPRHGIVKEPRSTTKKK